MSHLDLDRLFDSLPDACLVLDRDLIMVRANPAYTALAGKSVDELVGRQVADVFTVNPEDPDSAERLHDVYRRVLRSGTAHRMGVVRYDFPDGEGGFAARYWTVTVTPVLDEDGEVGHVCHRAREVTDLHTTVEKALSTYREQIADDNVLADAEEDLVAARDTAEVAAQLLAEVEQMRAALASRAGIEQAKGILMTERRCTPDEAFEVLKTMSQHTNRKLVDVAAALVATAVEPETPSTP